MGGSPIGRQWESINRLAHRFDIPTLTLVPIDVRVEPFAGSSLTPHVLASVRDDIFACKSRGIVRYPRLVVSHKSLTRSFHDHWPHRVPPSEGVSPRRVGMDFTDHVQSSGCYQNIPFQSHHRVSYHLSLIILVQFPAAAHSTPSRTPPEHQAP